MHRRIERVRLIEANILDVVIGRQVCHSHAIFALRHPGQNEGAIRVHPSEFGVWRRRVSYDDAVDRCIELDAHVGDSRNCRKWLAAVNSQAARHRHGRPDSQHYMSTSESVTVTATMTADSSVAGASEESG